MLSKLSILLFRIVKSCFDCENQDNWNVSILIVKYFLWSNKYYLDVCSEIRLDWHTISLSQVHLPLPIPPPPNTQSWWGSYSIGVVLTTYLFIIGLDCWRNWNKSQKWEMWGRLQINWRLINDILNIAIAGQIMWNEICYFLKTYIVLEIVI